VIIALGSADPFKMLSDRRIEYFNEAMLMITGYHLFCFTDFVPDAETRELVGLSLMVCTIFSVAVNLAVTLVNPVHKIRLIGQKFLLKLRHRTFKKFFKSKKTQNDSKEPKQSDKKVVEPNYRDIVNQLPDNNHPDIYL